jgi:hypothetical protein
MVKFEFKQDTWTNQSATREYRTPALGTDGTTRTSSNANGTAHLAQPLPVLVRSQQIKLMDITII